MRILPADRKPDQIQRTLQKKDRPLTTLHAATPGAAPNHKPALTAPVLRLINSITHHD